MGDNPPLVPVGPRPLPRVPPPAAHEHEHDMDEVLAYMHLMIEKAREAKVAITREALTEHGRDLDMFPGVEEWFSSINDYCKKKDVKIEHFAISSGLREMIKGSPIAKEFRHIFASGFS